MPVAPSKVTLSTGTTLDPPTTVARDFLQEQTYTVIAEDGSRQPYKVKADRAQYVDWNVAARPGLNVLSR